MGKSRSGRGSRLAATVALLAVAAAGVTVPTSPAGAAQLSDPAPLQERAASTVSADPLPTVQIDSGVVLTQDIVGNTVFAGGQFSNTRPAGAAPGTNLTPRGNLLAFDIRTGALVESFAPKINGQVKVVRASPDGTRLYVGGSFTVANGQSRFNLAAFSTATGELVATFKPAVGGTSVNALAVSSTTVYVGGLLSAGNGSARRNLMAFDTAGVLRGWAPTTDLQVDAMVLTPQADKLIVGGRFTTVNGVAQRGLVALDLTSGAILPWIAPTVVKNGWNAEPYAGKAGIFSLSTDGTSIFGTGWVMAVPSVGNLEGTFSADPGSGAIRWIADCHGDTYGAYSDGADNVYVVNHNHDCQTLGGYPQAEPAPGNLRHSQVLTASVMGTLSKSPTLGIRYADWSGWPAPAMRNWFPDWTTGTATGQGQAGWTVDGTGDYVVIGGEFPYVNGKLQQGLARFARESVVTPLEGPRLAAARWLPTAVSTTPGEVRVTIPENWDRDDLSISYELWREGRSGAVTARTSTSTFWDRDAVTFVESGLAPGQATRYRVVARDPDGNAATSEWVSATVATSAMHAYRRGVVDSGASLYWRLGGPATTAALDVVGTNSGVVGSGVTSAATGAVTGDSGVGSGTSGTATGQLASSSDVTAGNSFTIEVWLKTSTTAGGKIVGFGTSQTGASNSNDRHVYMLNDGRLAFGVYPGAIKVVTSSSAYNDGKWHHVAASLGPRGMSLLVDGALVGYDPTVTSAQQYLGYWRLGGDNLKNWPNRPTSDNFAGEIDEFAVYPTALRRSELRSHYRLSGRSLSTAEAPADAYGAAAYDGEPSFLWRFDDAAGSTVAADSGDQATRGSVRGTVRFAAQGALSVGRAATFDGATGHVVSTRATANPTRYTMVAWFSTTTTRGGKIIGFGSEQSGLSVRYDRHVYMQDDGRLVFGTYDGTKHTLVSSARYNDGKWHQVVAAQGPNGMRLYVDGVAVGVNATTTAQNFTGYWRVGGDRTWGSTSPWFAGVLDEVTVYPYVVAASEVARLYGLGAQGTTAHQPPTARMSTTIDGLTAFFDASGSTANGGATISACAWGFGDGSSSTAARPSHTYAVPGTYNVTLTVTDSAGASASTTAQVVVTQSTLLAGDTFSREVAAGWGSSDVGGPWNDGAATPGLSVTNGQGRMTATAAKQTRTALLDELLLTDLDARFDVSADRVVDGGGSHVNVTLRRTAVGEYRLKLRTDAAGVVSVNLAKVVGATETIWTGRTLPAAYRPGDVLHVRVRTGVVNGVTTLSAKIWSGAEAEPTAWSLVQNDTEPGLQEPGPLGLSLYVTGSSTNVTAASPMVLRMDDLVVAAP